MHKIKTRGLFTGLILSCVILLLGSCNKSRTDPGYDYAPDMYYSSAYESYSENPNTDEGSTQLIPPEGTIPLGNMPFSYEKNEEDAISAGLELMNPVEANLLNLRRGKEAYEIFCMNCHGELGDGQGFLYTSKKYPYPPSSLIVDKVKNQPDGQIYHSITLGYGIMGAHGQMIRQEDRWKIIHFIREELQNIK